MKKKRIFIYLFLLLQLQYEIFYELFYKNNKNYIIINYIIIYKNI